MLLRKFKRIAPSLVMSLSIAGAGFMTTAVIPATAHAEEWEENTPYYEDDAWYDVSEWLDGNDYNPTDEEMWEWDDEAYQVDYDETDWDNDNAYGYYDTESSNDWYYDYQDDSSVYDDANFNDGVYTYSSTFYDYDDDGTYDAYASYYDWDEDGYYDDYDYVVLTDLESADQKTKSADKKAREQAKQAADEKSSKDFSIAGEIQGTKKVDGKSGKHLVANVKAGQGSLAVDLGPAKKASDWKLNKGAKFAARGPVTKVGDKPLMLAKEFRLKDKEPQSIDRSDTKITGTIKDTMKSDVRGTEHQLAMVSLKDKDKQVLVDMGPAKKLSQQLSSGEKITVHGTRVKFNDKRAVLAQKVEYKDETIQIDRKKSQTSGTSDQVSSNS